MTDRPRRSLMIAFVVAAFLLAGLIPSQSPAEKEIKVEGSRYLTSTFESPFVAVAERLKASVVHINAIREREVRPFIPRFFENNPFFDIDPEDRKPRVQKIPSSGSGIIIDSEGYVLTNNHLVQDAGEITVKLIEGEEVDAEVVGADPETDLALLRIDPVAEDYVAPLGDSDKIRIGDWAIAMGNPLGLDWTLTVGVISAKGRSNLNIAGGGPVFQDFIQTDASINFGNSGGPLANIHGEVIGLNAAVNARAEGIGFAIPINLAKDVVRQLKESGSISRGYLGMVPRPLTGLLREALALDEDVEGVFVEAVEANTPAEEGDLREEDVIVEVDGEPVSDVNDFRFRVARHEPGQRLALTVLRDGKRRELEFTLANRAEYLQAASAPAGGGEAPWMGLDVESLDSPRVRRNADIEVDSGVIVVGVREDSPAQGVLNRGDVIVEIDQKPIENLADWRKVTGELRGVTKAVLVKYHPQGRAQTRYAALKKGD
ncbi:MAG: Periplasmic serine endoprotease DegP [Calditrichaeota bacterium]|nr:Periplasmic serine endoprotease DegP [Calditrichota bacterium]